MILCYPSPTSKNKRSINKNTQKTHTHTQKTLQTNGWGHLRTSIFVSIFATRHPPWEIRFVSPTLGGCGLEKTERIVIYHWEKMESKIIPLKKTIPKIFFIHLLVFFFSLHPLHQPEMNRLLGGFWFRPVRSLLGTNGESPRVFSVKPAALDFFHCS